MCVWGGCLRTENATVHLAALGSGAVWIRVSQRRRRIIRQEFVFNFLSAEAASVSKVPEKEEKMTNANALTVTEVEPGSIAGPELMDE